MGNTGQEGLEQVRDQGSVVDVNYVKVLAVRSHLKISVEMSIRQSDSQVCSLEEQSRI